MDTEAGGPKVAIRGAGQPDRFLQLDIFSVVNEGWRIVPFYLLLQPKEKSEALKEFNVRATHRNALR